MREVIAEVGEGSHHTVPQLRALASKHDPCLGEAALDAWRVRQITSQAIPKVAPAPGETAKHTKMVEDSLGTCTPASQQIADPPPAQRLRVQFAHDSAVLDRAANETLDAGAVLARDAEIEEIFIEGHADRSGASEHNLRLSMRRALAVWDQLIARGVSPHKIWIGPRGETMPETVTADGEKNAANRRVAILLEMLIETETISAEGCAETLHMTDAIS